MLLCTDLISHLLDPAVDPVTEELRQYKYEQIAVPETYSGPRLSFPLSVTDTNKLLSAFKEQQVKHTHCSFNHKRSCPEFRVSEQNMFWV